MLGFSRAGLQGVRLRESRKSRIRMRLLCGMMRRAVKRRFEYSLDCEGRIKAIRETGSKEYLQEGGKGPRPDWENLSEKG